MPTTVPLPEDLQDKVDALSQKAIVPTPNLSTSQRVLEFRADLTELVGLILQRIPPPDPPDPG